MDTTSLWEDISVRTQQYPTLTEDLIVDVAIIGGGITGVTAAAGLLKAGKKVAIIEAHQIGGETTGMSTGNLYIPVQPFYHKIESKFDFETAKAIAKSRQFAIDVIEKTVRENNINCNFARRPWYAYTNKKSSASMDKEFDLFQEMGLSVERVNELPVPFNFKKAIKIANQARMNPLQYVISLADKLAKRNCLIFENTRVTKIEEKAQCVLTTERGIVKAGNVFMATHTPIGVNTTQFFVAPYRSYVVGVQLADNNYPDGHFWNWDNPRQATSTHGVSENIPQIMVSADSHHKTGQGNPTTAHYDQMESILRRHFNVSKVAYRWSAQHYQSADKVPYIGLASRSAKHTFMATGYFADGLVYGTLAGMVISDLILKKDNPLEEVFDSKRLKLIASAGFLVKEGTNIFWQYLKDYPKFGSNDYADLKAGQGKVVEIDQEKFAISRDAHNKLHIVSAVCTHMKCIVNWNDAEKTWDCPCHGSRFTCAGKVIEGPAVADLKLKVEEK